MLLKIPTVKISFRDSLLTWKIHTRANLGYCYFRASKWKHLITSEAGYVIPCIRVGLDGPNYKDPQFYPKGILLITLHIVGEGNIDVANGSSCH